MPVKKKKSASLELTAEGAAPGASKAPTVQSNGKGDLTTETVRSGKRMKKWKQTVKKEAKAVTPATRRLIDATLNYWQPFPESLKYRIANKAELEVIDAKTFEIVLVLKKVRKRVFVFATPCVYGRPDFELVDVPHDKLDDLPGIMKKIQAWKEQEDSEEREYANRRRGTKVRGFITRGRSK